jgi:hypothetical protein
MSFSLPLQSHEPIFYNIFNKSTYQTKENNNIRRKDDHKSFIAPPSILDENIQGKWIVWLAYLSGSVA